MLDKLLLGRYIPGDSPIHHLDPRTKLLITMAFILIVFLANTWAAYGILLAFTGFVLYLSKIDLDFFLKGIRPMIWLILFTVVFQMLFSQGGAVYFQWGPIAITSEGIMNGIFIFIRLVLIIIFSTLLTLTTAPMELTDGLEYLLRPSKRIGFPAHEIALMLSIALRYVPTLMDEATKIMNAQRARGVDFSEGKFVERVQAFIPVLVPLFVSSFNRADEMANAMEARGYNGGEGRTKFRQLEFSMLDLWAWVLVILVTLVLVALRFFV